MINVSSLDKTNLEKLMEGLYYEKYYDDCVRSFALNLNNIWSESSAKELESSVGNGSAIVIGRGPSVMKNKHLEILAESDYEGSIICTDSSLIKCLKHGITPEKFPNYYVISIDAMEGMESYYDDPIVNEYGKGIKGIFSTVVMPSVLEHARDADIKIHWVHSLFDYHEGKKSFNQISATMTRAGKNSRGLPAIQTGGNVGTAAWFVGWKILKCNVIALIGIDHSWSESDSWDVITTHGNTHLNKPGMPSSNKDSKKFKKMFPTIYNPEFDCNCILDPIFQYYSNALKEFVLRSPEWLKTINATEGGCIFGERIECMKFHEFLKHYKH